MWTKFPLNEETPLIRNCKRVQCLEKSSLYVRVHVYVYVYILCMESSQVLLSLVMFIFSCGVWLSPIGDAGRKAQCRLWSPLIRYLLLVDTEECYRSPRRPCVCERERERERNDVLPTATYQYRKIWDASPPSYSTTVFGSTPPSLPLSSLSWFLLMAVYSFYGIIPLVFLTLCVRCTCICSFPC